MCVSRLKGPAPPEIAVIPTDGRGIQRDDDRRLVRSARWRFRKSRDPEACVGGRLAISVYIRSTRWSGKKRRQWTLVGAAPVLGNDEKEAVMNQRPLSTHTHTRTVRHMYKRAMEMSLYKESRCGGLLDSSARVWGWKGWPSAEKWKDINNRFVHERNSYPRGENRRNARVNFYHQSI